MTPDSSAPKISTSRHAQRAWPCRSRWNAERRKLWVEDPEWRTREDARQKMAKARRAVRTQAEKEFCLLAGWREPVYPLETLYVTMALTRNQVRALTQRVRIPEDSRGRWTISRARLFGMAAAFARTGVGGRCDLNRVNTILDDWWADAPAGVQFLGGIPEVVKAWERQRQRFATKIMRSRTTDLKRSFGLGGVPRPLPPREGDPLTELGKSAPWQWF